MAWVIVWGIAAVALFIAEVMTINTISICFVGGALVACLLAYIGLPAWLQVIAFIAISVILIFTARKFFVKKYNKSSKQLEDRTKIEGKVALVAQDIKPGIKGVVNLDGVTWTAVALDEEATIHSGERVIICRQEGTKCFVEKYDELKL